MEGGDLGWHGGVRGAEGGAGYGSGFFGTAYSLYAGRPEREEGRVGRGPKGYRRSDERIHDEVCERIARSGVNADDVEVKVENGEVTLTGTVEQREDKWHLETVCESVFGVDDVHDRLRTSDRDRRGSETIPTH
jgi:osmotically-inducible protein OsmY